MLFTKNLLVVLAGFGLVSSLAVARERGDQSIYALDGAVYTIVGVSNNYYQQGSVTLIHARDDQSGIFNLDFDIGGRPYRCRAQLHLDAGGLTGTANQCQFLDNGQRNPTTCVYDLTNFGEMAFEGPATCYGIHYRVTIQ